MAREKGLGQDIYALDQYTLGNAIRSILNNKTIAEITFNISKQTSKVRKKEKDLICLKYFIKNQIGLYFAAIFFAIFV